MGACEDGHATSNLRHWLEQRQTATSSRYGLVRNAGCAGLDEILRLLWIRREVQVGVEQMVRLEHGAFNGLRLFHLHDHLSRFEHSRSRRQDGRACIGVIGVRRSNAATGIGFDVDVVSVCNEFTNAVWGQTYAIFAVFDFLRNTDFHAFFPARPLSV